ncbi:MAG: FG-GAP-like repeat-containing protein, partial [bacterium]
DNDGDLDIVVAVFAGHETSGSFVPPYNPLYLQEQQIMPDGSVRRYYRDVTFGVDETPGSPDDRLAPEAENTTCVKLADFDADGDLDLFVGSFAVPGSQGGAQERLYINDGNGFFTDVTINVMPGILDIGPFVPYDGFLSPTVRSDVGDIDSDGDIDIVIQTNTVMLGFTGFPDLAGTRMYEDANRTDPNVLGVQDISTDGTPLDPFVGEPVFRTRILINRLNDKDPNLRGFYFVDDTLGRDHAFGGDYSGDGNDLRNRDRMPPLIPDFPDQTPTTLETDYSVPMEAILAPFLNGSSLDLSVVQFSPSIVPGPMDGVSLVYDNEDVDGDGVPDGYFTCINFNYDFFLYPLDPNGVQTADPGDGLKIGIPDGLPDADGAPGSANLIDRGYRFPLGGFVFDPEFRGFPYLVLYGDGAPTLMYGDPHTPIGALYGYKRGQGGVIFGLGTFYENVYRRTGIIYSELTLLAGSERTRSGAAEDFDFDGDIDIALFHESATGTRYVGIPTTNSFMLNGGYGNFTDVNPSTFGGQTPTPTVFGKAFDFDNDGDKDIFMLSVNAPSELWINQSLSAPPDLTSDADPPLFLDQTIKYMPPYASVSTDFAFGSTLAPNITIGMDAADVNGDSRPDVFFANGGLFAGIGDESTLYINHGEPLNQAVTIFTTPDMTFPAPHLSTYNTLGIDSPNVAFDGKFVDVDNDDDYDLFVANNGTLSRLYMNLDVDDFDMNSVPDSNNEGDGIFSDESYGVGGRLPVQTRAEKKASRRIAVGDINGDGLTDIVVANGAFGQGAPNVILLNGKGGLPGFFSDVTETNQPNFILEDGVTVSAIRDDTIQPVLCDFDNDGDLDLFCLNVKGVGSPGSRLLFNDGTGHFTEVPNAFPEFLGREPSVVLCADFNGDGEPTEDLNGNGVLDFGEDKNRNKILNFIDTNGNGVHDANYDLFIGFSDGPDTIFFNDGHGNFAERTLNVPQLSLTVHNADFGDVDLDGDLDIVVVHSNEPTLPTVTLYINEGNGRFHEGVNEVPVVHVNRYQGVAEDIINGNSRCVKLVDLDLDGDLDMVIGNAGGTIVQDTSGAPDYILMNRLIGDGYNFKPTFLSRTPGNPIIQTINPPAGKVGTTLEVTITGDNFTSGAQVSFGSGITVVGQPEVRFGTEILCTIQIDAKAAPGARQVIVTNPSGYRGMSKPGMFSVYRDSPVTIITGARPKSWTLYE